MAQGREVEWIIRWKERGGQKLGVSEVSETTPKSREGSLKDAACLPFRSLSRLLTGTEVTRTPTPTVNANKEAVALLRQKKTRHGKARTTTRNKTPHHQKKHTHTHAHTQQSRNNKVKRAAANKNTCSGWDQNVHVQQSTREKHLHILCFHTRHGLCLRAAAAAAAAAPAAAPAAGTTTTKIHQTWAPKPAFF